MTEKEEGYQQAVENLACYIARMSDNSFMPLIDDHPWIHELPPDEQITVMDKMMSDDELSDWDRLNEIMVTVSTTYGKTVEDLSADVMHQMAINLINSPEFTI